MHSACGAASSQWVWARWRCACGGRPSSACCPWMAPTAGAPSDQQNLSGRLSLQSGRLSLWSAAHGTAAAHRGRHSGAHHAGAVLAWWHLAPCKLQDDTCTLGSGPEAARGVEGSSSASSSRPKASNPSWAWPLSELKKESLPPMGPGSEPGWDRTSLGLPAMPKGSNCCASLVLCRRPACQTALV